MAGFWTYFKKTLRWPLIWQPGPLSALVEGGGRMLDQVKSDITWLLRQTNPATCEATYLVHHAASRGIKRWPGEPEAFFRRRVVNAFVWQKQAGHTQGLTAILAEAGISAEIIEPRDLRAACADLEARLDGSWTVDGTRRLETPRALRGLPSLQWAEFLVNVNWASCDSASLALARRITAEYKAARSLDKFRIYLGLTAPSTASATTRALALASSTIKEPPYLRLDGTWTFGRSAGPLRLDGTWRADGARRLGEVLPAEITKRLREHRWRTTSAARARLVTPPGPTTSTTAPEFRLSDEPLRLDGTWTLGHAAGIGRLDGTWRLDGTRRMPGAAHRLGEQSATRLDGNKRLAMHQQIRRWPDVK